MLFSHGITSSWGGTIGFFGTKSFKIEDIKSDKSSLLLLRNAKIDGQNCVLLNGTLMEI